MGGSKWITVDCKVTTLFVWASRVGWVRAARAPPYKDHKDSFIHTAAFRASSAAKSVSRHLHPI